MQVVLQCVYMRKKGPLGQPGDLTDIPDADAIAMLQRGDAVLPTTIPEARAADPSTVSEKSGDA